MPLLAQAKKVHILTIEAHNVEGPPAELLAEMLATQGIPVDVVHRLGKKRAAGHAYLEDAASLGGDLMIKGAYTQSRLRQIFFGGATAHILTKARMPVLMAN
jgi:nucleotide-binding universal stress UspA family protein